MHVRTTDKRKGTNTGHAWAPHDDQSELELKVVRRARVLDELPMCIIIGIENVLAAINVLEQHHHEPSWKTEQLGSAMSMRAVDVMDVRENSSRQQATLDIESVIAVGMVEA